LKSNYDGLKSNYDELKYNYDELKYNYDELKYNYDELKNDNESLKKDNKVLKERISKLEKYCDPFLGRLLLEKLIIKFDNCNIISCRETTTDNSVFNNKRQYNFSNGIKQIAYKLREYNIYHSKYVSLDLLYKSFNDIVKDDLSKIINKMESSYADLSNIGCHYIPYLHDDLEVIDIQDGDLMMIIVAIDNYFKNPN
jgi:hypothetical protein